MSPRRAVRTRYSDSPTWAVAICGCPVAVILLMASGIGITPMRALLEELDQRPGEVTLVYRSRSDQDRILVDELSALAEQHRARFFVVTGTRVSGRDSWLPQHAAHLGDVEALLQFVPDVAGDYRVISL